MTIDPAKREADPLAIVTWWRHLKKGYPDSLHRRAVHRDDCILYSAVGKGDPTVVLAKDLDATIALLESYVAERAAKKASPALTGGGGSVSQPPVDSSTQGL